MQNLARKDNRLWQSKAVIKVNTYITDIQVAAIREMAENKGIAFAEMLRRILDKGITEVQKEEREDQLLFTANRRP